MLIKTYLGIFCTADKRELHKLQFLNSVSVPIQTVTVFLNSVSVPTQTVTVFLNSVSVPIQTVTVFLNSVSVPIQTVTVFLNSVSVPIQTVTVFSFACSNIRILAVELFPDLSRSPEVDVCIFRSFLLFSKVM